jgi:hypothetical protein
MIVWNSHVWQVSFRGFRCAQFPPPLVAHKKTALFFREEDRLGVMVHV